MDGTFASGAGDAATPAAANNPRNTKTRERLIGGGQPCKCAAAVHGGSRSMLKRKVSIMATLDALCRSFLGAFARFSRLPRLEVVPRDRARHAGSASACSRLRSVICT